MYRMGLDMNRKREKKTMTRFVAARRLDPEEEELTGARYVKVGREYEFSSPLGVLAYLRRLLGVKKAGSEWGINYFALSTGYAFHHAITEKKLRKLKREQRLKDSHTPWRR